MSNPLVSRSPGNELWVLILEKAVAKIFESYYSISNLNICDFFLILTGCPTFHFSLEELYKNEGIEVCLKKLKSYVVDRKFIVVGISKTVENQQPVDDENEGIDDMLTLSNYGYTILDVKTKENVVILRKIWYDQNKDELCKQYEENFIARHPALSGDLYEGVLIMGKILLLKNLRIRRLFKRIPNIRRLLYKKLG
jgi:hypothetical protein